MRLTSLLLLAGLLVSGCAYSNYNRNFFAECRAQVPAVRAYAIAHLPELSDDDKRIINTTDPHLSQANWVAVYYTWPGICGVETGAPPECRPYEAGYLKKKP